MAVIRIHVCFDLPVPKDFDIIRICQVEHGSIFLLCEEVPILPVEFGKVSIFTPPFSFVVVAAYRPLPQSAPNPVAKIVECVGAVDKPVVVTPSSYYRIKRFNNLFGGSCLFCGYDFSDFVTQSLYSFFCGFYQYDVLVQFDIEPQEVKTIAYWKAASS